MFSCRSGRCRCIGVQSESPIYSTRMARALVRTVVVILATAFGAPGSAGPQYVINISVDGLGSSYLNAIINTNQTPNFLRMQREGAWTLNARNDYDNTVTVPNHTTILTGRGVAGADGHNYTDDDTPAAGVTIHSNKGSYVASVFDVAHDNGLTTALFANKSKFILYQTSYDADHGAPDLIGPDNGANKIDNYVYASTSAPLVDTFLTAMATAPATYTFLHLRDPDTQGHSTGWGNTDYNDVVKITDDYLGRIFNLIETSPTLKGKTTLMLTADHGGRSTEHSTITEPLNYTIPFFVWGVGAGPGVDLYAVNAASRSNPGTSRPSYAASVQPIRNGDMANLSLGLLGLGSIPGSTINADQSLAIAGAAPKAPLLVSRNYFLQQSPGTGNWTPGLGQVELGFTTTSTPQGGATPLASVYSSAGSPWRLRMQSVLADTTFAPVDVTPYQGVTASVDVMLKSVTYDSADFFRVTATNGTDTITLADFQGAALNALSKSKWLHYSGAIPDGWTSATLKISGGSHADTMALDFDNVEFNATPSLVNSSWNVGSGIWSDPAGWDSGVPGHAGDVARFVSASEGPTTVALDGRRAVSGLTFDSAAGYKLTGGTADALLLANGIQPASLAVAGTAGSHEIAANVSLLSDLDANIAAGTLLTLSGVVSGDRTLTKSGDGTLVLSGSGQYTGGTRVTAGMFVARGPDALPADSFLGIDSGAAAVLESAPAYRLGAFDVHSGGRLTLLGGDLPMPPGHLSNFITTRAADALPPPLVGGLSSVPEPPAMLLLAAGVLAALAVGWRRDSLPPQQDGSPGQARAETAEEHAAAGPNAAQLIRLVQRQRNTARRRVAEPLEIVEHLGRLDAQFFGRRLDDPHVRLMEDHQVDVGQDHVGGLQDLGDRVLEHPDGPFEDRPAFHVQILPVLAGRVGAVRLPRAAHRPVEQVLAGAVGADREAQDSLLLAAGRQNDRPGRVAEQGKRLLVGRIDHA